MENIIKSISLSLQGSAIPPTVKILQGDTARILKIDISDKGKPYHIDPAGLAVLAGRKEDRTTLYNVCDILDNSLFYHFTEQSSNCPGHIEAEIRLYDGKHRMITTMEFSIEVEQTVYTAEDAAKSADELTALNHLVNRTLDAAEAAEDLTSQIEDKLKKGEFNGPSAYETALSHGFQGTEAEWVESLRYDHSEEFHNLSDSVKQDCRIANQSAKSAELSAETAKHSAETAQTAVLSIPKIVNDNTVNSEQTWSSQKNCNSFSNAFVGYICGPSIVADDISPIPHTVSCRVFSKNMVQPYNNNHDYTQWKSTFEIIPGGIKVILQAPGGFISRYTSDKLISVKAGHTYVVSYKCRKAREDLSNQIYILEGSAVFSYSETFTASKSTRIKLGFYVKGGKKGDWIDYTDIQLEEAAQATPYTPYTSDLANQTISVSAAANSFQKDFLTDIAGYVHNLQSLSPIMTFSSQSSALSIEVIYNRDMNLCMNKLVQRITSLENICEKL